MKSQSRVTLSSGSDGVSKAKQTTNNYANVEVQKSVPEMATSNAPKATQSPCKIKQLQAKMSREIKTDGWLPFHLFSVNLY